MGTLHQNSNTSRLKDPENSGNYLFGKAFLYLDPAGEHYSDPGEFGECDHMAIRDASNVHRL
jgi:hypothetical protein